MHVIRCPERSTIRFRRDELLAAANPAQPLLSHQAFDRAAGNDDPFTLEEASDLAGAADSTTEGAVPEHPLNLHDQLRIRDRPRRGGPLLERVVTGRGDLDGMLGEHPADRLDPEPVTMIVDELNYHGSRGSSSRAKNEDAANRISFARLSSRTSASSALMR